MFLSRSVSLSFFLELHCYCNCKSIVGTLEQQAIRMLCWFLVKRKEGSKMYSFTGVNYLWYTTKFIPTCDMCLLKNTGDISLSGSLPYVTPLQSIRWWSGQSADHVQSEQTRLAGAKRCEMLLYGCEAVEIYSLDLPTYSTFQWNYCSAVSTRFSLFFLTKRTKILKRFRKHHCPQWFTW